MYKTENGTCFREIPVELIERSSVQPREIFSERELAELTDSIRSVGVIQPLTVRYRGGGMYELIAGERRLVASKRAGLETVPCMIMNVETNQAAVLALVENMQRKDLNFFEEARGIAFIIGLLGITQEEAAARIGKSQSAVANKLRLLKLPQDVRETILHNGLTERHARALLRLKDPDETAHALELAVRYHWNVLRLERYVEEVLNREPKPKPSTKVLCRDARLYLNSIRHTLGLMRSSGIRTDFKKTETEDKIEYRIVICK